MTTEACVVLVTCGSLQEAETIAESIVRERLAACVNVLAQGSPVRSFYMWEGALQKEPEYLLMMKTGQAKLGALAARIKELHSYTVPEVIALPVVGGSAEYLNWVAEAVQ